MNKSACSKCVVVAFWGSSRMRRTGLVSTHCVASLRCVDARTYVQDFGEQSTKPTVRASFFSFFSPPFYICLAGPSRIRLKVTRHLSFLCSFYIYLRGSKSPIVPDDGETAEKAWKGGKRGGYRCTRAGRSFGRGGRGRMSE